MPHAVSMVEPIGRSQVGEGRRQPAIEQMDLRCLDEPFGRVAVPRGQAAHQKEPFEHGDVVIYCRPVQVEAVGQIAGVQ